MWLWIGLHERTVRDHTHAHTHMHQNKVGPAIGSSAATAMSQCVCIGSNVMGEEECTTRLVKTNTQKETKKGYLSQVCFFWGGGDGVAVKGSVVVVAVGFRTVIGTPTNTAVAGFRGNNCLEDPASSNN